jgi:hypothetical protein
MNVRAFKFFPGIFFWPYATWYNEALDQLTAHEANKLFQAGQNLYYTMPLTGDELFQITWAPITGATPKRDTQRPYVKLSELHFERAI